MTSRYPLLALAALLGLVTPARAAEPARVFAAGSLAAVLPQLITGAGLTEDKVAPPVFGPAGALRHRIEGGEPADLFLSADMAQPVALASRPGVMVIPFARNRMCIAAPAPRPHHGHAARPAAFARPPPRNLHGRR